MSESFEPFNRNNYMIYHKKRFGHHMNDKQNSLDEASYRGMNDCVELFMKEYMLELWNQYTIEFVCWLEQELQFKGFPKLKITNSSVS